jgi:hypothetical protein
MARQLYENKTIPVGDIYKNLARIIHKIWECLMNTGLSNFQAVTGFIALNPLSDWFTDSHGDFGQIHE